MSRDRLFAAQFLAVAMFFLFLPGVSHPDSTHNDECDTSTALSALVTSSSSSSHAISATSGPRLPFASGRTEVSSLFYDGKVDTAGSSGSGTNLVPVTSFAILSDLGNRGVSGTGAGGTSSGTGTISAIRTAAGSVISEITTIPEPEVMSLIVLGLAFLIIRRMLIIH